MSLAFVEHLFKQRGQDFRRHVDGSLAAEFRGHDQSVFVMGFSEIHQNIAQGQVWFPPFDRTLSDPGGLCRYINSFKMDFLSEFDSKHNRLGVRAYFEKENDVSSRISAFVLVCDFGLGPLSLELNRRGGWTPWLVDGYMTGYSRAKLN